MDNPDDEFVITEEDLQYLKAAMEVAGITRTQVLRMCQLSRTFMIREYLAGNAEIKILKFEPSVKVVRKPVPGIDAWKICVRGGMSLKVLAGRLARKGRISGGAKTCMVENDYPVVPEKESISLILLSPSELGFDDSPTTAEIFNRARLDEWAAKQTNGATIGFCPLDTSPHLCDQTMDWQNDEFIWFAMDLINLSESGSGIMFAIKKLEDGIHMLFGASVRLNDRWPLDRKIAFHYVKNEEKV